MLVIVVAVLPLLLLLIIMVVVWLFVVVPALRLSEAFEETISLKAGASSVVEVPFVASPKPTIKWTFKPATEGAGETSPRFKPDTAVAGLTSLPLGKVKREDAGDYSVSIANELGEVSTTVHLIVLDKPSAPRNPHVTDNTGERVVLNWQQPEFTGLLPGDDSTTSLEYVIEMREASQRVGKPVTSTTDLLTPIESLQVDKTYIFAVAAKNAVGQSDFAETKPVSTKLSYGPPPSPTALTATVQPEKAPATQQAIHLTWQLPADEAASTETPNYLIEMKPKDSSRWQEVTPATADKSPLLTATEAILPTDGLKEFTDYEFRVTARNKAGASKPSQPSNAVQLGESQHIHAAPSRHARSQQTNTLLMLLQVNNNITYHIKPTLLLPMSLMTVMMMMMRPGMMMMFVVKSRFMMIMPNVITSLMSHW